MMNKVAVIGLDGAAPQLVFERWRDELPNLENNVKMKSFLVWQMRISG